MRRGEAANLSQLRVGVLFNAQVCGILRWPTDGQTQWALCAVESERTEGGGGTGRLFKGGLEERQKIA